MNTVAGVVALVLLVALTRRVIAMYRLAKSDLFRVDPESYNVVSLANSKAFWWTLIPFIVATTVFFTSG